MEYTKEVLADKKIKFTVKMTAEDWAQALENAYNATKGKYRVQGFRAGKAPRKVIEKEYGDTVFYDEAIDNCFYRYYFEVLSKEKSLEPVAAPDVNISKIDDNGLELVVKILNKPEVTLGAYKDLTVEKEKVEVTDHDVEHELEHIREHRVKYVSVDEVLKLIKRENESKIIKGAYDFYKKLKN